MTRSRLLTPASDQKPLLSTIAGCWPKKTVTLSIWNPGPAPLLPTVRVDEQTNYQLDSIKRREDYKWLYPVHPRKLIGNETPADGVGIVIAPNDYFSARETQKRRLRHRLAEEEKEYYIDSRFPAVYVAKITGLKGDSLQVFLVRYRPTYDFCRKASNEDIFLYINDKVGTYRKHHA